MIRLNGQEIPVYTSGYDDSPVVVKTDNLSINGSIERHSFPSKKRAKMTFTAVTPAQFRFFESIFNDAGTVKFYNDQSKYGMLQFDGIMTDCDADEYIRGGSLMTSLTVTIREV